MDAILKTGRSAGYAPDFEAYRHRQRAFLQKLQALPVPERLRPVHAHIVTATEQQIALYHDFAHAESRDASVDLRRARGSWRGATRSSSPTAATATRRGRSPGRSRRRGRSSGRSASPRWPSRTRPIAYGGSGSGLPTSATCATAV